MGLSPNNSPSLDLIPRLKREVVRIEFRNGGSLEIATNNAALVRGRSAGAVFGSECCHWKTDEYSASSDEEVVGAAEPAAARTLWLETDPLPKTEGININHKPKPASHDLAQANRGE
jgi:hypothetical protein